jgi:hypothetical protein
VPASTGVARAGVLADGVSWSSPVWRAAARAAWRCWAAARWVRAASVQHLSKLLEVHNDNALYDRCLRLRLRFGDHTAVPDLLKRMRSEPADWWKLALEYYDEPGVGDAVLDNVEAAFRSEFDSEQDSLCSGLPPAGIEALVRRYPQLLRAREMTWHALWRSHVATAQSLVSEALASATQTQRRHFLTYHGYPFSVTADMLDAMSPVLSRFDEADRRLLARCAWLSGFEEWVRDSVPAFAIPALSYGMLDYSEREVLEMLGKLEVSIASGSLEPGDVGHLRMLQQGKVSIDLVALLRAWYAESASAYRLAVVALILNVRGTKQDTDWWKQLDPGTGSAHGIWSHTLAQLRRRHWIADTSSTSSEDY